MNVLCNTRILYSFNIKAYTILNSELLNKVKIHTLLRKVICILFILYIRVQLVLVGFKLKLNRIHLTWCISTFNHYLLR